MSEILINIAWLAEYSKCYDCWTLPCHCKQFDRDMKDCIDAIEMGYY